ncbi:DUF2744 domain-containing protein [Nocardia sp. NPDC051570]|uniref:phage gene 29 protein family protein n=1 Tax=Nocardia sp. NPDC051570 TaxID=3364324 RepID=UPI0037A3307A
MSQETAEPGIEASAKTAEIEALKDTFRNVPGLAGAPMIMAPALAETFATHQHELGVRVHPDLAVKKFIAPFRGPRDAFNPSGDYGAIDTPATPIPVLPNMREYTPHELEVIVGQLRDMGVVNDPEPPRDVAHVVTD